MEGLLGKAAADVDAATGTLMRSSRIDLTTLMRLDRINLFK
jgi:hypothetical protein